MPEDFEGPDAGTPEEWPDASDPGAPDAGTPPLVTITYAESAGDVLNPERGFYGGCNLVGHGDASGVRAAGRTLAIAIVRLDAYRDAPLDAEILADLDAGFAQVRSAGVKVVLRFAYNASFAADAPLARILGHIAQLAPVLAANADVIAVMQAGFIGAWGEWHSSTNGLENDADRSAILTAILAALPASRSVQVRTPMFKEAIFPGGPIGESEAFSEDDRARTGHHNDCFLASDSDYGTYASPVSEWKSYVADDTRFAPMGGETCALNAPRTSCAAAIAEMAANHWSYLNIDYHPDVIGEWDAEGCDDQIRARLGYRFALQRAVVNEAVAPGGVLSIEVDIANTGFAAPYNARPLHVVLQSGDTRLVAPLAGADVRRWAGGEVTTLSARLRIPAGAPPGTYRIALWLPDESATLQDDPRFAVRFANDGVWSEATGDNVLTEGLRIDPTAPGAVDPAATEFVELP